MNEDKEQGIEASPVMMPATAPTGQTMGGELRDFVPETAGAADWVLRNEGGTSGENGSKVGSDTGGGAGELLNGNGHLDGGNTAVGAARILDGDGLDSRGNTAVDGPRFTLSGGGVGAGSSNGNGSDNGENTAVDGVLAPSHRNKDGTFALGWKGGGKPAKDKALLIALNEHYPPETVVNMVQEAWDSAATRDSWRGMLEVARFLTEYIVGKPVARSITVSSKAGDMLARLEAIQLGGNDAEEQ